MELKLIEQKDLDTFVINQNNSQFLESSSWSNFQENVGHRVWRFGIFSNQKVGKMML